LLWPSVCSVSRTWRQRLNALVVFGAVRRLVFHGAGVLVLVVRWHVVLFVVRLFVVRLFADRLFADRLAVHIIRLFVCSREPGGFLGEEHVLVHARRQLCCAAVRFCRVEVPPLLKGDASQ